MQLGVCYYPEHWPRERWSQDAKLMRQAGLSLVRIAEFAWALMEPKDGEFDWDWLDQAIDTLAAEGLQVILGTPTAAPPVWLSRAHPKILPVDGQGQRKRYGSRRHYCPNSDVYRRYSERIVLALATRYGHHSAVAGWQIDNEFGCHDTGRCYCENCARSFRVWLEAKYSNIEALNDAWGAIFWSQVYSNWDEIDPPILTVAEPNPSHVLDYYRFSSDSFVTYLKLQLDTLQKLISERQFVTTNYMSQFTDIDYYKMGQELDFVTMSSYPTGHAESGAALYKHSGTKPVFAYDVGDPYVTGLGHTLMRGYKPHRPFWIMEQQCGQVNWSAYNTGIRPGAVRLWTWHALASGADAVIYFRWRAGLYAQEQFHSGLLQHDATPALGYNELGAMREERALMSEISSAAPEAKVAILLDYDSLWALRLQPHHRDYDYMRHLFVYFLALQRLGVPVDIVSIHADLSAYKLVIAPAAFVSDENMARSLKEFAQQGGTALLGIRSGFKTSSNLVSDLPLPGHFRDLVGVVVSDWHSLPPGVGYEISSTIPGLDGNATVWAEALNLPIPDIQSGGSAPQILAQYRSGPFISQAALVERKLDKGRILYLSWYPNESQAEALLMQLSSQAGIIPLAKFPEGLIASQRGSYLILLNFTEEPLEAVVQGRNVLVKPRDVEVLRTNG